MAAFRPRPPGPPAEERAEFVRSLADVLAACEDVQLLRQHRDAIVQLDRSYGDALLSPIREATLSCHAGCTVREFWQEVVRSSLGTRLHAVP
jgi:hypothetical protein